MIRQSLTTAVEQAIKALDEADKAIGPVVQHRSAPPSYDEELTIEDLNFGLKLHLAKLKARIADLGIESDDDDPDPIKLVALKDEAERLQKMIQDVEHLMKLNTGTDRAEYSTQPFKCYDDFLRCSRDPETSIAMCVLVFITSLAGVIIPLAGGSKL
ncbi:MAG: hypothetical protein GKS03_08410 [Alphaproteobacteria bacterium]|nr:hypothetical protein [Alphaproteobacteria bacterium]